MLRKNFFKVLCGLAMVGLPVTTSAQEVGKNVAVVPTREYSVQTNDFWSNWFFSVGGSYISNVSQNDATWGDLLFDGHYGCYGFNVAIGKWFTPGLGLRFRMDGVVGTTPQWYSHREIDDTWAGRMDVMFNMSNLFYGYSDTRVWNLLVFGGFGGIDGKSALDFGLQSNWKLTDRTRIFVEAGLFGAENHTRKYFKVDESKYWDWSVGFTFDLGKNGFKKSPDIDALMALNASQLDALNVALADQLDEQRKLKGELAKSPTVVVKKEVVDKVCISQRIFFNIGSFRMVSKKDLVNLEAIANVLRDNDLKVSVTGYADSATGSISYNQILSEKRAEAVAAELEKMGIKRDRMIIEGKGGVSTLNPVSYNRCVCVEVME